MCVLYFSCIFLILWNFVEMHQSNINVISLLNKEYNNQGLETSSIY